MQGLQTGSQKQRQLVQQSGPSEPTLQAVLRQQHQPGLAAAEADRRQTAKARLYQGLQAGTRKFVFAGACELGVGWTTAFRWTHCLEGRCVTWH